MKISNKTIVSLRYGMKNSRGEVLTAFENSPVFTYLYGSGQLLPSLEAVLEGMETGDEKSVRVSRDMGLTGLDDDFLFDIVIDHVRMATADELKNGYPQSSDEEEGCGDQCDCK